MGVRALALFPPHSCTPPFSHLPPTALTHTHRYSDSACTVHVSVDASSGSMNTDSMIDTIMPAGAEACFPETGSLAGKYTKAIADSTGVTFSQFTVADCTGTAAETTKVTPGKCTSFTAKMAKFSTSTLEAHRAPAKLASSRATALPRRVPRRLGSASQRWLAWLRLPSPTSCESARGASREATTPQSLSGREKNVATVSN